jgi:hypothetical protein
MHTMPHTITPRTPLTLTELETLATLLDNATQHMNTARDAAGNHAWDSTTGQFRTAMEDMFAGFFALRDNTAILTAGPDGWPYDLPEAAVMITAVA